jgi:hypothetical protein
MNLRIDEVWASRGGQANTPQWQLFIEAVFNGRIWAAYQYLCGHSICLTEEP